MDNSTTAAVGAKGRFLPLLPVMVLALVAFLPALRGEFLDWDDGALFLENENYRGLGLAQIRWMFTHATLGHYQPISWLTLGADYCLWGMSPVGYHVTSLLFHLANTALVYVLALALLRRAIGEPPSDETALRWTAAACAGLFAVHPLRAESVAWITERGSLVSTCFLLVSVLSYIRFTECTRHHWRWYLAALGLYSLSLLSKAWGITLPVVLLLIDIYPLRRWPTRDQPGAQRVPRLLLEKLPFVIVAMLIAALAYYAKSRAGMVALHHHGWPERFAQAAYGLCFYPLKTLWPTGLGPIYELPIPFDPASRPFIVSGVVCVVLALTLVVLRRQWPAAAAAALAYAILVSPALGIAQTGPQLVADRYSYVSCIPFALLAGGALLSMTRLGEALSRRGALIRSAATTTIALIIVLLAAVTWTQTKIWRSSTALWTRALEIDPRSPTANNNMGAQFVKSGQLSAAIECFRANLAVNPDDPAGIVNLASALARFGGANESRSLLRQAVEMDPKGLRTLTTAARVRAMLSDDADEVDLYRRALSIDPREGRTHHALGAALAKLGEATNAADSFERAVSLLEPRVESGVGGETERLYLDACQRLVDFFSKREDHPRAETYRRKIEALGARD